MPQRAPDMEGPAAQAWEVPKVTPAQGAPPAWQGAVGAYLIHMPGVHAVWSWWSLSVVHLRPIEGAPPAVITLPGATHELLSLALNPEEHPERFVDLDAAGWARSTLPYLMPPDIVQQFQADDDAQALQLLRLAVRSCCDGRLTPDADWRRAWRVVVPATAAHLRAGLHRPS